MFVLLAILLYLLLLGSSLFAETTASDVVGVSYTTEGTVLALGMVSNNRVSLTIYAGFSLTEPGASVVPGGTGAAQSAGGRLHYTVYGMDDDTYKITVGTQETDYNDGTLSVQILSLAAGGSNLATLGTAVSGYVPINTGDSQILISGIAGLNTWSGTDSGKGAWVRYKLSANPGGVSGRTLLVEYTILAE
ncbi:hypothetical protein [uncultured Sphaerochaeta sp.]|uniref:hypothetical protein n=1 Tax=uncultured Sphaerochaeta sp. TaxID=886478 RepID=UPI002A0A5D5E|nr:hypothetical protein [uncultured Sphaerochaeta sp.]